MSLAPNTLAGYCAAAPQQPRGPRFVLGTRGSALALWQARWVQDRLRQRSPRSAWSIETIATHGDHTQALGMPLAQHTDTGVFVAELERALLSGALIATVQPEDDRALAAARYEESSAPIDAAVHSLKDLPSTLTPGLTLAAVTAREDPRDALVSRAGWTLASLPHGAIVATGSLRRRAQLLHLRPDLHISDMRGNVDTRVRKALAPDGPDAAVLAVAGMKRLALEHAITEYLPVEVLVPAVGQGALAIEVRASDARARRAVRGLDAPGTRRAVTAERTVLAVLGGGCQVPLGAHAWLDADGVHLHLLAVVAMPDGQRLLRVARQGLAHRPVALGRLVARELMRQGAGEILRMALAC